MLYNRTYALALRGGKRLYKQEQEWFKAQARRDVMSGYAILEGVLYLILIVCIIGLFMWLVPMIGRV